jgi:hypothetical protein
VVEFMTRYRADHAGAQPAHSGDKPSAINAEDLGPDENNDAGQD